MSELYSITENIISQGKGILAADESTGTMTKRLDAVNVPSTPENRLLFRETLLSSQSMKDCIGGVILYDETIKQIATNKKTIPELISSSGAVTGTKVDTGAKVLANSKDEKITEGLDGLRERLKYIMSLELDLQNGEVFIIFQTNSLVNLQFMLTLMLLLVMLL